MRNRAALLTTGLRRTGFPLHMAEAMARRIVKRGVRPRQFAQYYEHWGKADNYVTGFVCSCGEEVCHCITARMENE